MLIGPNSLLVLDNDGTLTDAESEGKAFQDIYLNRIADMIDLSYDFVEELTKRMEEEMLVRPEDFPFIFNGLAVAPASLDPYLRSSNIATRLFDLFQMEKNPQARGAMLGRLYKECYALTGICFRRGVLETLLTLEKCTKGMAVVTNSDTGHVKHKLTTLGTVQEGPNQLEWLIDQVYGNAQKFVIDPNFDRVEATLEMPGLNRPVLLRRRHYIERLLSLCELFGVKPEDTVVVGDIAELDLMAAYALNMKIVLVCNNRTPNYELDFMNAHPDQCAAISSITDLPKLFM